MTINVVAQKVRLENPALFGYSRDRVLNDPYIVNIFIIHNTSINILEFHMGHRAFE